MAFEIASFTNTELHQVAADIDSINGNANGIIDGKELTIFNEKAKALLKEGKCTEKELSALCNDSTTTATTDSVTDTFKKAEPEASVPQKAEPYDAVAEKKRNNLKKELQELEQEYKELSNSRLSYANKINDIKKILEQKSITYEQYDKNTTSLWENDKFVIGTTCSGFAGILSFLLSNALIDHDNIFNFLSRSSIGLGGIFALGTAAVALDWVGEKWKGLIEDTRIGQSNFRSNMEDEIEDLSEEKLEIEEEMAEMKQEIEEFKQKHNLE